MIVTKDKLLLLWPATKGYGLEMGDVCNSILVNTDFSIYLEFKVSKNELYNNEPIFIISKFQIRNLNYFTHQTIRNDFSQKFYKYFSIKYFSTISNIF